MALSFRKIHNIVFSSTEAGIKANVKKLESSVHCITIFVLNYYYLKHCQAFSNP